MARDDHTVRFRVTTAGPLSPPTTDGTWMTLLIDADGDPTTGWNGYDLLVNRARTGDAASAERYAGDGNTWAWTKVADAPAHVAGDAVTVAVPRPLFGGGPLRFDFKWTDNLPAEPTLADFYTRGDVAPDGRFAFHYAGQ